MIVMKFGGTSNQDAAAMRNVIRIVSTQLGERPVVVISAIARATNDLEAMARHAAEGASATSLEILSGFMDRHAVITTELLPEGTRRAQIEEHFGQYRKELELLITGVGILKELTPRTLDAFSAYGERFSSRLIAAGLQEAGVNAIWLDAKGFMITDENFGRARPLMDEVTHRLDRVMRPVLAEEGVPVTQGFIGATESGLPTTMGRESSDYSASVIGAALNASRVEIWTDVDGILSADPGLVSHPRLITHMSFAEAFELSYFGAKVLHPNTMLPVMERGIPVSIRNSRREAVAGTLVDNPGADEMSGVKSISYKKGLVFLAVHPRRRVGQYIFWQSIFSVLTRADVACNAMATSEYGIALAFDARTDLHAIQENISEFGTVEILPRQASVCLVGHGLRPGSIVARTAFNALGGINISMVSFGASSLNLLVVMSEDDVVRAVNNLHDAFFGGKE